MEEDLNRHNSNKVLVDPEATGSGGDVYEVSDERNQEIQIIKLKQGDDESLRNKELDEVYERSSAEVKGSMRSNSSLSVVNSSSINDSEKEVDLHDHLTRSRKNVFRLGHIFLLIYAVTLFVISYHLSRQNITQLVGQSIPQVTVGLGILTLFILALGIVANRRYWICGFNVKAVCLIILALCKIFIIAACVFQEYDIFYQSDTYWSNLRDAGKARIMANWQCCGWSITCDINDPNSLYHEYRHYRGSMCLDAISSDTRKWMLDVTVIFSTFTLFDILYVVYVIACQRNWLRRKRQEKVKVRAKEQWELEMSNTRSWRKSIISMTPRRFRQSMVARRLSRV